MVFFQKLKNVTREKKISVILELRQKRVDHLKDLGIIQEY